MFNGFILPKTEITYSGAVRLQKGVHKHITIGMLSRLLNAMEQNARIDNIEMKDDEIQITYSVLSTEDADYSNDPAIRDMVERTWKNINDKSAFGTIINECDHDVRVEASESM